MVKHFVVIIYEAKLLHGDGVDVTTKSGDVMSCHEVSYQHVVFIHTLLNFPASPLMHFCLNSLMFLDCIEKRMVQSYFRAIVEDLQLHLRG